MTEEGLAGGVFGWLVIVVRSKGSSPERYYVGIGDKSHATTAIRVSLKLRETAEIDLRHALSRNDVLRLNLRHG